MNNFKDFIAEATSTQNPKKSDFEVVYGKNIVIKLLYKGKTVERIGLSLPSDSKMDLRYFNYFPKNPSGRPYVSDWRRSTINLEREIWDEVNKIGMVQTR